ncbi:unnamed protein product [Leptosia nina]|uniref:C3H1-type domain-containing protein n=1 Tax=Leptosia nina TaxID=320188 RepID=A0AAV1JXU0_9NEOP
MLYELFFIPFYVIYTYSSHIDKNNSDVIITYEGHNEAERVLKQGDVILNEDSKYTTEDTSSFQTEPNDIVFIPNEREVVRNEDKHVRIDDLMQKTNIHNIMKVSTNTESPTEDIIFISGKNNENVEKTVQEKPQVKSNPAKPIRIDCTNLDCNSTMQSVCGEKEEDRKLRYRVFLNECYFRKVNCAFKHQNNRYRSVSMEYCKNIGGRVLPKPYMSKPSVEIKLDTRRFSSRRTLNMGVDGTFCGHACPTHCTEEYDPQCAVSASGEWRVFVNHCQLDFNSCLHGAVWQRRPLSECVGGKKADMRQNRGFIGWLQRVGIVDKRGKLVLSK